MCERVRNIKFSLSGNKVTVKSVTELFSGGLD